MAGEISEEPSPRNKFPRDKNQYVIAAATDLPDPATIYQAKYFNPTTGEEFPVGIKIFNTYNIEDIYSLTSQLHLAETFDHENLIKVHCSFKEQDDRLWIIMSPPGVSIKSMLRTYFRHGMPENILAYILKETLKALHYMHVKNELHKKINPGCIFLDEESRVKLAYDSLVHVHSNKSSSVVQSWISLAPEIMVNYRTENSKATDIWMFGLLALELFYGEIPASDIEELQKLVIGIQNEFGVVKKQENHYLGKVRIRNLGKLGFLPCFNNQQRKKIPKLLGEVMASCLSSDPGKRPSTNQLMESKLFQGKSTDNRSLGNLMKKKYC